MKDRVSQTQLVVEVEIGECSGCGRIRVLRRRRTNTAYADDELNFSTGCKDCFDKEEEYWQERWEDLYADRIAGLRDAGIKVRIHL